MSINPVSIPYTQESRGSLQYYTIPISQAPSISSPMTSQNVIPPMALSQSPASINSQLNSPLNEVDPLSSWHHVQPKPVRSDIKLPSLQQLFSDILPSHVSLPSPSTNPKMSSLIKADLPGYCSDPFYNSQPRASSNPYPLLSHAIPAYSFETSNSYYAQGPLRVNSNGYPKSSTKRIRRKFDEIVRNYKCQYKTCTKSYGTLNHLNSHIVLQNHGRKRLPSEFAHLEKPGKPSAEK